MSKIVEQLRDLSVNLLSERVRAMIDSGDSGMYPLSRHRDEIVSAFGHGIFNHFEELLDRQIEKPEAVVNFETLSLVQDDDLETMVALEGMVNSARNAQLPTYISFNTRLNSLFENKQIDESTNPLDPSLVASALKEAIQSLGIGAKDTMAIYRTFNRDVLLQLAEVLSQANKMLMENGVLPDLKMDSGRQPRAAARSAARPQQRDETYGFGTVEEQPHAAGDGGQSHELFSMMQNLLHREAAQAGAAPAPPQGDGQQYMIPASPAGQASTMQPFTPPSGQQVQMVDQGQLMEILTNIQRALETSGKQAETDTGERERVDITSQLGEMLQEGQAEGVVSAVDRQSSDIINLVTLLYEAIWQDDSVPIPIKELIGRTQVTIIKVALSDTEFFNNESHPARIVLNDFAEAGIGWTKVEDLESDPLYQKIEELVNRILTEYTDQPGFFDEIIKDFRSFQAREAAKTRALEQRILRAEERQERLDDIHELVNQKIEERVLGRDLSPFVNELLEGPFHKFMVMLVLKEGPGTNAWKQAINTIDVLLWTVQPHEHSSDRERLKAVNPRLVNNLRKAFRIAQVEPEQIDEIISQLREVQDTSFAEHEPTAAPSTSELDLEHAQQATDAPAPIEINPTAAEPDDLDEDDPTLQQVDQLSVGVWVEFAGDDPDTSIRCKLAAKINAIDKFIFVNRQGVKVVEKTRMGLARELKDQTVRFISDGPLFSRALESVIGNLRETQHEQHTGGAYQPSQEDASA